MSVDLSGLRFGPCTWQLLDFGGLLTPPLGGPVQRIERAGSRWSIAYVTPLVDIEPEGRLWSRLIARAKRQGALVPIVQDVRHTADGIVSQAVPAGRLVPVITYPFSAIRAGAWVSIVHSGRRYADQVDQEVIADAAGHAVMTLQNLLRVPLAVGDVVELVAPCIEGWLTTDVSWQQDLAHMTSFAFTVSEIE